MALQIGIVGLPNVGKSTLFNAITQAGAEAANFPFCTKDPNVGTVLVPDERLERLNEMYKPKSKVPAMVEFVDIAGLVKGAAEGEGMGNQFLSHIRETAAVAMVVRCFEDKDVVHVAGKVSPLDDIETIHTELALADLQSLETRKSKLEKLARGGDKEAVKLLPLVERLLPHLSNGKPARTLEIEEEEREMFRDLFLLTAKPTLYVANVDEGDVLKQDNAMVAAVRKIAEAEGSICIAVCAKIEAELSELEAGVKEEFLADLGLKEPGLNRLIRASYELLGLQSFYTAGEKECRAWTIKKGATAPQAAGVIHTDFERGFIRAEVMNYNDLQEKGSEKAVKEAGLMRSEGKEYVMRDGDIVVFRFNV